MKYKLLLVTAIVVMLFCSACIYLVVPESTAAPGATPRQAQESRAAEVKTYNPSVVLLPDLIPTRLLYDPAEVAIDSAVYFDSSILNIGSADSDDFNIKWFVNGKEMGYGWHPPIRAGNEDRDSNSQFKWIPQESGTYKIEFVVDCDEMVDEENEFNNTAAVTITIQPPKNETATLEGPYIEGLELRNGIYYYKDGNRFEVQAGYIAGYVLPNVYVNDILTGAVCLKPIVTIKLLNDAIVQTPSGQICMKTVLPFDIAGFEGKVQVGEMFLHPADRSSDHRVLYVYCDGSVNVLNTIGTGTLIAGEFELSSGASLRSVTFENSLEKYNPELAFRSIVFYSNGTEFKEYKPEVETKYSEMYYSAFIAEKEKNSIIFLDFIAPNLPSELTANDLLTVDGYPVFINQQ